MEQKPNDTPKIIGLVIGIFIAFGFIAYVFLSQTKDQNGAPNSTTNTATPGGSTANLTPAGGQVQVVAALPGQVRFTNVPDASPLDRDPSDEERKAIAAGYVPGGNGRGDVFRQIAAPVVKPPTPKIHPVGTGPGATQPSTARGVDVTAYPQYKTITEYKDLTVEGIVTGPDGFAMITEGGQTLFRHVGDVVHGYTISRLGESGVTVKQNGRAVAVWSIGVPSKVAVDKVVPITESRPSAPVLQTAPLGSSDGGSTLPTYSLDRSSGGASQTPAPIGTRTNRPQF